MPSWWLARRNRWLVRSPACTFSKVMSYSGSPSREGVAEVVQHLLAARADVDLAARVQPIAAISRCACASVRSLVAKPGIV